MYFIMIILLMFVFPVASIATNAALSHHAVSILFLTGKWFVFWAVGVRLFIAGMRQVVEPQFTAEKIFGIHDHAALPIVREVGFANLSMGLLGICTMFRVEWIVPAAIAGGLYYGLAGAGHLPQKNKNSKQHAAMLSDAMVSVVLLVFVLRSVS